MGDGVEILTGDISRDTLWVGRTPAGAHYAMSVRPGTSDWNTVNACARPHDEYGIPEGLSGWALDIGAHIGACTIPLLIDNPDLRVIAVEALPENVDMLRVNAARNAVSDRLTILHRAASDSAESVWVGYPADEQHRYIGNADYPGVDEEQQAVIVDGVTLGAIVSDMNIDRIAWAKIDCEGCEYPFLDSPWIDRIDTLVGEHHRGIAGIHALLDATHTVDLAGGTEDFGTFRAERVAVPA